MANGISINQRKKADGSVAWDLRVRKKGQTYFETFFTKTTASKAGSRIAAEMDAGTFVPKSEVAQTITLAQALDKFIDELPTKTETQQTYKSDRLSHANMIKKHSFADLPLPKIEKRHVREFREKRTKEVKPNTVENNLNTISKIFSYANEEWDMKLDNPVKGLKKKLDLPAPRERRLVEGEEEIILQEARAKIQYPWFSPLAEFLINSGMRLGEVTQIAPEEVDLEKRLVYLRVTKSKNPRWAPITAQGKKVLEEFKPHWGKERVFQVSSNYASSIWSLFQKDLYKRNLIKEPLHFHDLRHEGISRLFEMQNEREEFILNVAHIVRITGHKDLNTLVNVYANFSSDKVVTAMKSGGY